MEDEDLWMSSADIPAKICFESDPAKFLLTLMASRDRNCIEGFRLDLATGTVDITSHNTYQTVGRAISTFHESLHSICNRN